MPIHYGPGWTKERVELLKKLWHDGLSCSQIAKQLGYITRNAVIGKITRLGLGGRASPSKPQRTVFRTPPPQKPAKPRVVDFPKTPPISAGQSDSEAKDRPMPKPVERPAAYVEKPGAATALTLGAHMCKWPLGDPALDSFRHCGQRQRQGSPYCDHHHARAYAPVQPGRPRTGNELQRSLRRYV